MNLPRLLLACLALVLLPSSVAQASAPGATTGPATNVSFDSATLTGVVNPNKEDTTYYFEYGATDAYGAKTADAVAGGNAGKEVAATITGLAPDTLYHFRLVATNPSGTDTGDDLTFTTTASPYVIPPTITIAAAPGIISFGGSSVVSGTLAGPGTAVALVQLQQSPHPFAAFTDVGDPVATDAAASYSFTVKPGLNTRYRVVAATSPPVTSAETTVRVRTRVTLKAGAKKVKRGRRVVFKGKVTPAHDGRKVKIQRRTKTGFKTVAKAVLRAARGDRSSFRKKVRVKRRSTFRVVMPGHADHAAGTSRTRTVRVGS